MLISVNALTRRRLAIYCTGGFAAGFVNAMLGSGGGILLLYALHYAKKAVSPDEVRDQFATVISVMIPLSVLSAIFYFHAELPPLSVWLTFSLPGVAGGILGAMFLDRIHTSFLKNAFSLLTIYAGIQMLLR